MTSDARTRRLVQLQAQIDLLVALERALEVYGHPNINVRQLLQDILGGDAPRLSAYRQSPSK